MSGAPGSLDIGGSCAGNPSLFVGIAAALWSGSASHVLALSPSLHFLGDQWSERRIFRAKHREVMRSKTPNAERGQILTASRRAARGHGAQSVCNKWRIVGLRTRASQLSSMRSGQRLAEICTALAAACFRLTRTTIPSPLPLRDPRKSHRMLSICRFFLGTVIAPTARLLEIFVGTERAYVRGDAVQLALHGHVLRGFAGGRSHSRPEDGGCPPTLPAPGD